jgi:hypothetical protein
VYSITNLVIYLNNSFKLNNWTHQLIDARWPIFCPRNEIPRDDKLLQIICVIIVVRKTYKKVNGATQTAKPSKLKHSHTTCKSWNKHTVYENCLNHLHKIVLIVCCITMLIYSAANEWFEINWHDIMRNETPPFMHNMLLLLQIEWGQRISYRTLSSQVLVCWRIDRMCSWNTFDIYK